MKKDHNQNIRRIGLKLITTVLFLVGFLIGIVLNPTLLYAKKTTFGNYTIFHNSQLDKNFIYRLEQSKALLQKSELYDANFKLEICLNDGSLYPKLLENIVGQAFGLGFYNKIVLMGKVNWKDNFTELNGYKFNLSQLLAHEAVHCLQFNKFGLWKSNPMANYPTWKWEGYPEYVARRKTDSNLQKSITRKINQENFQENGWAISFEDRTITPSVYYDAWLLMQYCLDVKKMTYKNLLKDTTSQQNTNAQMMKWFVTQKISTEE